jgi:hypothetical protein
MAKIIKNIFQGAGDLVGGLLGMGSVEMPKVAPPPPMAPAEPVKAEEQDKALKDLRRPGRVSSETSAITGARGVLTEAPIEYKTLLGGKKRKQ